MYACPCFGSLTFKCLIQVQTAIHLSGLYLDYFWTSKLHRESTSPGACRWDYPALTSTAVSSSSFVLQVHIQSSHLWALQVACRGLGHGCTHCVCMPHMSAPFDRDSFECSQDKGSWESCSSQGAAASPLILPGNCLLRYRCSNVPPFPQRTPSLTSIITPREL